MKQTKTVIEETCYTISDQDLVNRFNISVDTMAGVFVKQYPGYILVTVRKTFTERVKE